MSGNVTLASSTESPVELLAQLPPAERQTVLASLSRTEQLGFAWAWRDWWARSDQLAPIGDWLGWLLLAGRGFGKTRTGAEWVRERVERGGAKLVGLIGRTATEVRDVMVEGPAGILAVSAPHFRPTYQPGKKRLVWPNGSQAFCYSADRPDQLRGPQHDTIWADELAAWRYPEAWDNAVFGLRYGQNPRAVVTTTPRPTRLVRELLNDPDWVFTRGSTYENAANLPAAYLATLQRRYAGTRLGRQELLAELLEDTPGALWTRASIDEARLRWRWAWADKERARTVVAIDPAVTSSEEADETGIIVAAKDTEGHGYILADLSGRYSPGDWAKKAIEAYRHYQADRIVAEVNNGGDLVEATLRVVDENVSFRPVYASRGKYIRAEPVAALYEQRRIHHLGVFDALEEQMCGFTPDIDRKKEGSPDRVDALVWGVTDLLVEGMPSEGLFELYRQEAAELAAAKAVAEAAQ